MTKKSARAPFHILHTMAVEDWNKPEVKQARLLASALRTVAKFADRLGFREVADNLLATAAEDVESRLPRNPDELEAIELIASGKAGLVDEE